MTAVDQTARRIVWSTTSGLAAGALAFFLILLDFGTDLGRTAVRIRFASNFFDLQASAFLDGRLWVPEGSLTIEGFTVRGHEYMYFPPFPAILRIPVQLVTNDFDGRLSVVFMGLAWVLFATMTVKLLWLVRRIIHGDAPVGRSEAIAMALFLTLATGGTVVTFDASLPWVYHEVYLWAVGLVVGSLYWLVRCVLEPTGQSFRWLGAFALATIWTRTTGGWAVCLAILAVAIWWVLSKRRPVLPWLLAGGVPLALGIAYNYAKFRHPYLFPLEDQHWTQVNAHRREALEFNGGTITGPQFFTTSFVNYLRPNGIRFVDYFPWVTLPAHQPKAYGGAFIDQSYRTGSVTAFMPGLFLLMLAAVPVLLRRRASAGHRALLFAMIGGVLVTGGVMAYGYLAYRYTSEFVPALVVGGAVGLCGITRLLRNRRAFSTVFATALAGLTLFGIAANMLTAYAITATTYRGDRLTSYIEKQLDSGPPPIRRGDGKPEGSRTDEIYVRGDCDAVHLNTGDAYEPWILVEQRDRRVEIETGPDYSETLVPLFSIVGSQKWRVALETNDDHEARILVTNESGEGEVETDWFGVYRDNRVIVSLRLRTELGSLEVSSQPGGFVAYVPFVEWDDDWNAGPGRIVSLVSPGLPKPSTGLTVTELRGVDSSLCERILEAAE